MKNNKNLKLILLDMDGVLFNTKLNMQLSWKEVRKKSNVKKNFKKIKNIKKKGSICWRHVC